MVRFTVNGIVIALVQDPVWVNLLNNGTYGLCTYDDAQGVVLNGVVYNMPGHNIAPTEEIEYEIIESGTYIMQKDIETEQMLTDLDIANIEV